MSATTPARRAAFEVVRRVFESGAWADRALEPACRRARADGRERALAQYLAYGAVRRRGTADHFITQLSGRPAERLDPPVLAALRLGLFELLFSAGAEHAAVDQAVSLARSAGAGRAAGLVNAVLRRAAREGPGLLAALDDATPQDAAVRHSMPLWLCHMWWSELGPERARSLMAAMNEPAETSLRANLLRCSAAEAATSLAGEEIAVEAPSGEGLLCPPEALIAGGGSDLAHAAAFREGLITPQSRASMAVVAALDPRPGERVLDACAAPGVKATQIAARLGDDGEVVAVDRHPDRLEELRAMARRLGARSVHAVEGDAAAGNLGERYDRVLVDPPCSNLGTLASRPDARWRKEPAAIDELSDLQGRILEQAGRAARPGGTVLYSTCTISRRENEDVIQSVCERAPLEPCDLGSEHPRLASQHDRRALQTRPDRDRTDGFFMCRLRRTG